MIDSPVRFQLICYAVIVCHVVCIHVSIVIVLLMIAYLVSGGEQAAWACVQLPLVFINMIYSH